MNSSVIQWAIRHQVSQQAIAELEAIWGNTPCHIPQRYEGAGESTVQSLIQLEAVRKGVTLWRNNVGVLRNPDTGQPVRYGLANNSKTLNESIKSGDLIGWRPIVITAAHIGHTIAQFVSRECKHAGWTYTGKDREPAQLRWAQKVIADGGDAAFANGEGTL